MTYGLLLDDYVEARGHRGRVGGRQRRFGFTGNRTDWLFSRLIDWLIGGASRANDRLAGYDERGFLDYGGVVWLMGCRHRLGRGFDGDWGRRR